jgi:hypothetical protein
MSYENGGCQARPRAGLKDPLPRAFERVFPPASAAEGNVDEKGEGIVATINRAIGRFLLHGYENTINIPIMRLLRRTLPVLLSLLLVLLSACASRSGMTVYHDPNFDFASVRIVAVLPFENLSKEPLAASRVRDVLMNMLLSTGSVYVLPAGEVARGMARAGIEKESAPTTESVVKLGGIVKADAVITGVVREYGEIRSGSTSSNVVSLSVQMIETQTGRVVWTASSTRGGISTADRLFGGGGRPMDDVTREAVIDVLNKLF